MLLVHAEGPTLQVVSIKLTSLLGGGLLGIYLLGFLTRKGEAQAVWCGIAATLTFTLWTIGGIPGAATPPFDTYYTAFFGNLLMFVVGYTLGAILPGRPAGLDGLTVWDRKP